MSLVLKLIGYASGIAANNPDCALAPWHLYNHPKWFEHLPQIVSWHDFLKINSEFSGAQALPQVSKILHDLSDAVLPLAQNNESFVVIGGDHSSAVGTWSAVAYANRAKGDIGLIWFDAHMDSHTPKTSITQNIHGMPLAALLGEGAIDLCQILDDQPKLKSQNVCLIGVRSYEEEERQFLESLGVRIYYIEEIKKRGLNSVVNEAYELVNRHTCGFGISIDMDIMDPEDAPGVGCRESGGIHGKDLLDTLTHIPQTKPCLGMEITEYNPLLDKDNKTAHLLISLLGLYPGLQSEK